jgi:hypothetical protein
MGNITLGWLKNASSPVPANDNFAYAQTINGFCTTVSGTNLAATTESGEANHAGNVGGVSFSYVWTAPLSGRRLSRPTGSVPVVDLDAPLIVVAAEKLSFAGPAASAVVANRHAPMTASPQA